MHLRKIIMSIVFCLSLCSYSYGQTITNLSLESWVTVGGLPESSIITSLAVNQESVPYVVLGTAESDSQLQQVMELTGNENWTSLGIPSINHNDNNTSILANFVVSQSGNLYLAWCNLSERDEITSVFTNDTWTAPTAFTQNPGCLLNSNNMSVGTTGYPFIGGGLVLGSMSPILAAAQQTANNLWQPISTNGIPNQYTLSSSTTIAPNGTQYMFLAQAIPYGTSIQLTVESYDSSTQTWNNIDPAGSIESIVTNTDIAIAPNGTPYIMYATSINSESVTTADLIIAKYDGHTWKNIIPVTLSTLSNTSGMADMVIANNNIPYVVFYNSQTNAVEVGEILSKLNHYYIFNVIGNFPLPAGAEIVKVGIALAPGSYNPYVFYTADESGTVVSVLQQAV